MARITVANRQRRLRLDTAWLRRFALAAVAPCAESSPGAAAVDLPEEVEVSIVSDRVIARVHGEFMGLPDPTDVITFHHGEILASADTAAARAPEFGHPVEAELALYIVHGLLHLRGFDDVRAREAARMHKVQDRIWRACLASLSPPLKSQPYV